MDNSPCPTGPTRTNKTSKYRQIQVRLVDKYKSQIFTNLAVSHLGARSVCAVSVYYAVFSILIGDSGYAQADGRGNKLLVQPVQSLLALVE